MLSLQLAQAGSKFILSCGNPTSGCDVVLPALLCWRQPSTRILGIVQKACVDFGGHVLPSWLWCKGNDVGCSSASAMPDIFQSVLKEEFSLVSHLSQLVVWVPVRVGSLCVPHMSHSWLGHGFQKHTSDQT